MINKEKKTYFERYFILHKDISSNNMSEETHLILVH